VAELNIKHL